MFLNVIFVINHAMILRFVYFERYLPKFSNFVLNFAISLKHQNFIKASSRFKLSFLFLINKINMPSRFNVTRHLLEIVTNFYSPPSSRENTNRSH